MSKIEIKGATGYGLMSLTWRPHPIPYPQAFEAINNAIADGITFLNAGEFYGMQPAVNGNLLLLKAYFEKYPENRSKVVVSVKGSVGPNLVPDNGPENLTKSINHICSYFPGEYIDIFEPARMDGKTPVEDVIKTIIPFIEAGKVGGISLSEVNAQTIERAAKVYPISCVEVEFSLWETAILTNGVADVCKKYDIPIAAYSPLGRGFLTGQIKSTADVPEGDIRHHFDKFTNAEHLAHNFKLVEYLTEFAKTKGCTPAQLALSWIRKYSEHDGNLPRIIPIPSSSTKERNHENNTDIELTEKEFEEVNKEVTKFETKGYRYNAMTEKFLNG
ncbi:hypothetical protein CANARDRAFT_27444 [[Candida] arabinofermentans NRRL YB-2248]|uniref:NADP-dependent oxidoreductase domain-containing protein n=1 Tax=[Candida] arabinofermentans NRRL YB-2248 TaxID=983967 RepID=A0A1E4T351_9ASCO|nr:hypothetical protein CANARDRAFT_27444 [[Candida] arabinofermentans NRRL YB-2248]